jgi:2-polyprenyl-3-methyl-5-hydroxy-6-metoxy-1,4-benzoquinol methylase
MKTIDYYNNNSQAFYDRTINSDITESYEKFLKYLPEKATILDAGCGVGRDIKYFLSKGHSVSAFDASEKMVELAYRETGVNVTQSTFQELNFENMFDGIWAQASLLHVPYDVTQDVYKKIHHSLKPNGIFYASYKYGDSYMETPERDFYNMNENKVMPYLMGLFNVIELWQEKDNRSKLAPSPDGMWLNFIARKI